ncbi:MAG: hypothetical protein GY810_27435 [Aureispira sp.]|nr:hypothetical protein [Aureispira sp.]
MKQLHLLYICIFFGLASLSWKAVPNCSTSQHTEQVSSVELSSFKKSVTKKRIKKKGERFRKNKKTTNPIYENREVFLMTMGIAFGIAFIAVLFLSELALILIFGFFMAVCIGGGALWIIRKKKAKELEQ